MPSRGMRSLFLASRTPSFSISGHGDSPSRSSPSFSTPRRNSSFSFSSGTSAMADQVIDSASTIITKWDPDASAFAKFTSLFHESKTEAAEFLRRVSDLQKAMHSLMAEDSSSAKLIDAQTLMQTAMKRLQKEFYQILSMNRAHLDPESVSTRSSRTSLTRSSSKSDFGEDDDDDDDDEHYGEDDDDHEAIRAAGGSISEVVEVSTAVMADLKSIADCMISSGYAKECVSIYKIIRKSIIDEGIYRLGVERVTRISKLDWPLLDFKIKNWIEAVKIAMKTLFAGERILCDHVFAASESIRESCFSDISGEGAAVLFAFPELAAKYKKAPFSEKLFRFLDMYTTIAETWPEIESIFSFESTSEVRSQALTSLIKIGESVRQMILDFEPNYIHKESSRAQAPNDGGVHPLTTQAMNHLSLLADYSNVLGDILNGWSPPEKLMPSSQASYFEVSEINIDETPTPASEYSAWLILSLLRKLDAKAKLYKDVSLAYLFLANNLQHVVSNVRTSNLRDLLGEQWIGKNQAKVKLFAANYERAAWGSVFKSLPDNLNRTTEITPGKAKDCFKNFNSSFEHVYKQQRSRVVQDAKLREEIKESLARKLVARYREFYEKHRVTLGERYAMLFTKFAPEDVDNYLSNLFLETSNVESPTSRLSSSSTSSSNRRHSRLKI